MKGKKLKGLGKLRYVLFLLKPYWKYGKTYVLITLMMSVIFQPFSAYLATRLPQKAIDALMAGAPHNDILLLIGLYTLGIALVSIVQKIIDMAYSKLALIKIMNRIRNEVNEKALFTDFKYYDNPEFFTQFMFAQEQFPIQAGVAMRFVPDVLKGVVTAATMSTLIAVEGSALLGITLFFLVISALVGLPTIKPEADYQVKCTEIWRPFEYVNRMLKQKENAAALRSSGAGLKFLQIINVVMQHLQAVYRSYMKKVLPFFIAQGILSPVQSACVLAYVILFVIGGDVSKIGLYASLTAASTLLTSNLGFINSAMQNILQNILYGERIAAFFDATSEIEPPRETAIAPPEGVYDIEFRDVSFGYENAGFCIEHLNLHIKPGQRVAIVGENGAGKTTFTKLLLRLYDTSDGLIFINGRNIQEYDIHALRRCIGVVFQDVRVLAMSLRDNLTVYHEVSDEKLLKIIKKIGLEGVIEKAGGDLNRIVSREFSEYGIVLSGGEAQRVSLARLFTGPFGLLLLDEPSSALDPLAEHKLMQIILDASNTATTIMIAHRLSTIRNFDVIFHMDNGQIIESGSHDELMANHGKYYEMFTRQAENYQIHE